MPNSQIIQQTYDRIGSAYDFFFRSLLESGRIKALEALNPPVGAHVLEIGIGTGLTLDFYPKDIKLTAFDFSFGMLKESQKKLQSRSACSCDLLQMDVQNMSFANHSFDYILAAYVITVVEDTARAVRELFRVAKPGARVVLINHLRSDSQIFGLIETIFNPIFSGIGLFTLDRDLLGILKECGAENIEVTPSNFFRLHHIISFTTPR